MIQLQGHVFFITRVKFLTVNVGSDPTSYTHSHFRALLHHFDEDLT
jgi:hypothetical protein